MNDDVDGITDVGLDGRVGEVHAALQHATRKPRQALLRRAGVNGGECAGVTRVQKLQKIEGLAAPNFTEQQTVGAMAQAPLHLTVENAPIEMIKKLVAVGVGVGFVPLMSVREEREKGELAVIQVDGLHLERSVWLVRRRAVQSPAAKAFLQTAVAFGEQLRGRAPAIMPKAARCSPSAVLKREKVLLVKRQA
jgi:DNA-binding transcriptional LysR family regulator